MHRAYTSILPTTNKYLQQQWDTTYYNEHRRKVKDAAPMVDTKAPPTYMHLHLKLKKLQLEEERLATIERDNRILLEKMSYIMRTRGRVDNRNNYEYKSLNREKRQRELLRVTAENRSILHRITLRGAEYSAEQLQRDWEENQQFMDSISRFPKDWWKKEKQPGTSRQNSARSQKKQTKDDDVPPKDDDKNDDTTNDDEKDSKTKGNKESKDTKDTKDNKESKTNSKSKTHAKSPDKGSTSPTKGSKSPTKGSKSPTKGSKSPTKGAKGSSEEETKEDTKKDDDTKKTESKDDEETKTEQNQEEENNEETK